MISCWSLTMRMLDGLKAEKYVADLMVCVAGARVTGFKTFRLAARRACGAPKGSILP